MTEVEVRAGILMGEAYFRHGRFEEARLAFAGVGHKDGLIACGENALKRGWFEEARLAFAAAGVEMPKDGLIACGEKAVEHGRFEEARLVFEVVAAIELAQATQ
ncbi:MAG TPA: hypothetical protein VF590_24605 [Isosphaeraceae bacterium]|jgi:hypothetical protein